MEISQNIGFDSHKHNNLIIQKLKNGKEKKGTENSQEYKDQLEKRLGNIFREISLRNESNSFRITMNGEIQKMRNLSKLDAYCKFMMLSYSRMFFALIDLKNNCGLEDVQFHTLELRKLNYIFKNCTHFNIKYKFLEQKKTDLEKKTISSYEEVSIPKQEKYVHKNEFNLLRKIDSLNNSVDDLKNKIKNYFSKNIQEEMGDYKKTAVDNEPISLMSSHSDTNLCNSESSNLETFNDENSTNSEEETNMINTNKHLKEFKTKNKQGFRHRRSIETISFTGNKLENTPLVEFSPAPKYHSRSKTQNTNLLQQEQSVNSFIISYNGILLNKSTINNNQFRDAIKAHKIVESANLNQKLLFRNKSNFNPHQNVR
ncbi:uncharacterized protein cubi_02574 [Cryptosporidium ubiquitum]|uniref:Uncharacterized protein n=1 Tax=Cryptosporidium ubiquitum TaxID=857276 RepID=A0A1J4MGI3_9CRYT|nr:uncharacterized protein cubi_02574 [Cryptosporidium ubiquitum]OII73362.1 hypothetical protein cubi_02574 [Cryptosporidium ubiquitum]